YREFSDAQGSETVNLQGIVFNTNDGGRLPLEAYVAATIAERESLATGRRTIAAVAHERKLNAKYLGILWTNLAGSEPSLILNGIREHWRRAQPKDTAALTAEISDWQRALWRFRTVGHIGKVGGPKRWLESVDPVPSRQELRCKLPATTDGSEVVVSLVASDAG